MAENLGPSFDSIAPIDPLILHQAVSQARHAGSAHSITPREQMRLVAARQHLDAAIACQTQSRGRRETNALAVSDLTITGLYVMPSRRIESEGHAAGVISDPLTGYPYGQVEAAAETEKAFHGLRLALAAQRSTAKRE